MGIGSVDELGRVIDERWRAAEYVTAALPGIAASALEDARLPERLSPDEIVRWALHADILPPQRDLEATFGQPPLTLFRSRRFYIEALHWLDGTTTIHQHSFSGAFQVLAGSSLETRYRFSPERELDDHFVLGRLESLGAEFHLPGHVVPIRSGRQGLIHSLFHLDRPSVTIVVRTFHDEVAGPQLNYERAGIGVDPFSKESTRDRVLQLVRYLRAVEHPDLENMVGDLVSRSDLHTSYRILDACLPLADRSLFGRLVQRVRDSSSVSVFRRVFEEKRRISFLHGRRALVRDPDLRFMVGVLLNAVRREDAVAFVRARHPGLDAGAQIAKWIRALSKVGSKLQAAGLPWEPNILGLPEFDDERERALAAAMAGREPAPQAAAATFLAALRELPALAGLFG